MNQSLIGSSIPLSMFYSLEVNGSKAILSKNSESLLSGSKKVSHEGHRKRELSGNQGKQGLES